MSEKRRVGRPTKHPGWAYFLNSHYQMPYKRVVPTVGELKSEGLIVTDEYREPGRMVFGKGKKHGRNARPKQ